MELLILVVLIGIVLTRLYDAHDGASYTKSAASQLVDSTRYDRPFHAWSESDDYDIFTNPAYSHIPGNIYYYHAPISSADGSSDDDLCTSPAYSFLPCNIHHTDED